MTLNITVLTPNTIYQSADFKLTDFDTGEPQPDPSPKTVKLTFSSWWGFITYTGVGKWRDRDVSSLIVDWLTGADPELNMADTAQIVQAKGAELLQDYERFYPRRRHTFTLAGFEGDQARAYVISNFEDCYGHSRSTLDDHLTVTTRSIRRGTKATVIVTGYKSAVPPNKRRLLGRLAANYPDDGLRIRRRMAELNAEAAPNTQDKVSEECVVLSFRIDGTGIMFVSGDATEVPQRFPHIMYGVNTSQVVMDALEEMGVDPSQGRMIQVASFSGRSGPRTTSPAPCRYAIVAPDLSAGYRASEIPSTDFELMRPVDINNRGQVIGTGRSGPTQPLDIPWSWRGGQLDRLNFTGMAKAVNGAGQVAAVFQVSGRPRAALYQGDTLIELAPHYDESGVSTDTGSVATAINNAGTIAGHVQRVAEERSSTAVRAAIFHDGQPAIALEVLPDEYDCQAIDINEEGHVLVVTMPALFEGRCILWDPADGSWSYVGDETTSVFPVALNDDGVVLGQAKNAHAQPVAVICIDRPWLRRPDGEVVLLPYLTDHGTTPDVINNLGQIVGAAGTDNCWHAIFWNP